MALIALNFTYKGSQTAETFKFYKKVLRGFLRWHRTRAVWFKGVGKRKAYLLMRDFLKETAISMFTDALRNGGYFKAQALDPIEILQKIEETKFDTVGYLSYSNVKFGNPEDMWCSTENYRKVSVTEYCIGKPPRKPCPHWSQFRCIYPNRWKPS